MVVLRFNVSGWRAVWLGCGFAVCLSSIIPLFSGLRSRRLSAQKPESYSILINTFITRGFTSEPVFLPGFGFL